MTIRTLHISDLHFDAKNNFDQNLVIKSLIEHVELTTEDNNGLDLIFVTGDIAYSGSKSEYIFATEFFDKLINAGKIEKNRLFVVPGNHDVNRNNIIGLARTITSTAESDAYFDPATICPHIIHGQREYAEWYNTYFEGVRTFPQHSSCSKPELISINGISLSVSLLNSALFCRDNNDAEKLWIGRRSLHNLCNDVAALNANFDVLLMHHPFSYLACEERVHCERMVEDNFDVVLSGHLHDQETSQRFNGSSSALRIVSGATYQGSPWKKASHWIIFDQNSATIEPICYHENPKPTWTRDTAPFPTNRAIDYTNSFDLTLAGSNITGHALATSPSFEIDDQSLFQTRAGKSILINPRICDVPISAMTELQTYNEFSISHLASISDSLHIEANNEHGGTVVGKLLLQELIKSGKKAAMYHASDLPNYEKKLIDFLKQNVALENATIIIDDYDPSFHKKLFGEIVKTGIVSRIILIVPVRSITGSLDIHPVQSTFKFINLHIWGLDRPRIRQAAIEIFDSNDESIISAAVDKTYSDLNTLCIPLTPSNVIMYLHILWKESEFYPLDRISIIDRYLSETLTKSSDIFVGSFNVRNKFDLLSSFCYKLFSDGKANFTDIDFIEHCKQYTSRSLLEFDYNDVLSHLKTSRIIVKYGSQNYFRYSFLYSYFVGRYVALKPDALAVMLKDKKYQSLNGLVEVICGLSNDPSILVKDLRDEIKKLLEEFETKYVGRQFDPLSNAKWIKNDNEKELLWDPIRKEMDEGPIDSKQIDNLKTSITSESRTTQQEIVWKDFSKVEHQLFAVSRMLSEALLNSDNIDGDLKKECLDLLFHESLVVLQVGTLFSPILERSRLFQWGGLLFVNEAFKEGDELKEADSEVVTWVVTSLNHSVGNVLCDRLGSRKLGGLYASLSNNFSKLGGFEQFLLTCLIIRTKPVGWHQKIDQIIRSYDHTDFRLSSILRMLRQDFRTEINLPDNSELLKELISLVITKRSFNKNSPGNKAVSDIQRRIEKNGEFGAI